MQLSKNVQHIEPSATLAVASLARELRDRGRPVIDLSAGQPDFNTPEFIADAGVAAIRQGKTRYAPAAGLPKLRGAIAGDLAQLHDVETNPAGVVVTAGAKQALFNTLFTLFGPGDRVLVPAPYWTSYPYLVHLARAEPVVIRGPEERGFRLRPADLDAAFTDDIGALLINSPSNPSGTVYSLDELREIAEWAVEHDVRIVSDEIYNRISFDYERAPGLLDLDPELREQAVVIGGASKAFAMTGWRIGYSYTAPSLAKEMAALQSHVTTSATTPAQVAAVAAFSNGSARDSAVRSMVEAFGRRRDRVLELVESLLPDARMIRPGGAFYVFLRVDSYFDARASGSVEFCRRVLEEAEVALVPGAAFGDDRYVRLSFAASEEQIVEGFERIGRLFD